MQNRWFQFWGISKPTYNVHSYKTYHIQKLNHTTCATHTHQLIRIHTEHIHNTYMCRIYIYITIFIYPLSTPILSILSNIQIHTHACMLHVLPASMYNTTHAHINKWLFWHYPTTPRLTYINGRTSMRILACWCVYHITIFGYPFVCVSLVCVHAYDVYACCWLRSLTTPRRRRRRQFHSSLRPCTSSLHVNHLQSYHVKHKNIKIFEKQHLIDEQKSFKSASRRSISKETT